MAHNGFSSRFGYILAAAGSAVGLGNIWRFPYLAAKYGGGIFLLTYLVMVLTFGYAMIFSENCIGRMTGKNPVGAFRDLCSGKGIVGRIISFGGPMNALVPMIVLPYYCVIGAWVTKYAVAMMTEPFSCFSSPETSGEYFDAFVSSVYPPVFFFFIFVLITVSVVFSGIVHGIEMFNKILMPMLVLLILSISIYCLFLPDSGAGVRYYLMPDISRFSFMTIVAAAGQLFFSLSIAMGIMITYGAYMRKEDDLISSVNQVEFFDTSISFLVGLMIIPAVVAFGGVQAAEKSGPELIFVTMPQVFASFNFGRVIGIMFFLLVLFAAATSAVALLETNVHTIMQELKISRKRAILYCFAETLALGITTTLGYSVLKNIRPMALFHQGSNMNILDSLDFISNNILMPVGAIFTVMLVLFVIGLNKICDQGRQGKKWRREMLFRFCMTFVVIPCLLIILLDSVGLI